MNQMNWGCQFVFQIDIAPVQFWPELMLLWTSMEPAKISKLLATHFSAAIMMSSMPQALPFQLCVSSPEKYLINCS